MNDDTTNRLPRYRRAAGEVSLLLTDRDLDILAAVESHRLLTSEHVQALIDGSGQQILRRLQKLYHAGYLDRIRPRVVNGGGSAKMVYAVTNKGVGTLQKEARIARATTTDWNAQNRDLHDFSIRHQLLVSHVRCVVELACKGRSDVRLLFWKEGREMYDSVEVALAEGYIRVPVAPDAYFALEDPKGRMNFFLEADRGTMTVKRFTRKLKAYAAYFKEAKHKDKLGIRYFRVLTVTTSPARSGNLVSDAERHDELRALARMFLFSGEENISVAEPESILGRIWTTAARNQVELVARASADETKGGSMRKPTTEGFRGSW